MKELADRHAPWAAKMGASWNWLRTQDATTLSGLIPELILGARNGMVAVARAPRSNRPRQVVHPQILGGLRPRG
jgi:hypothetical protein